MILSNTCIVVDSSSGISADDYKNIFVLPLEIIETSLEKNETTYKDGFDIKQEDILEMLKNNVDLKTSQTPIGLKMQLVDDLFKKFKNIIVIPISSGISGAYNSWLMVKKDFSKKNLYILDSKDIYIGTQTIISNILKMLEKETSIKEIDNYIEDRKKRKYGVLIIKDITQLKKGGRINSLKAFIVKTFKMNLLISFDGSLNFFDKDISLNKSIDKAIKKIDNEINFFSKGIKKAFMYTTYLDKEKNEYLANEISKKIGCEISYYLFPSTISIHTGVETFSLFIESN